MNACWYAIKPLVSRMGAYIISLRHYNSGEGDASITEIPSDTFGNRGFNHDPFCPKNVIMYDVK